jgi:hypothetical protein
VIPKTSNDDNRQRQSSALTHSMSTNSEWHRSEVVVRKEERKGARRAAEAVAPVWACELQVRPPHHQSVWQWQELAKDWLAEARSPTQGASGHLAP